MKRRSELLLLIALLAGASGCAGTARRDDGSSIFGPTAWNKTSAPPQRPVALTSDRSVVATDPVPLRDKLTKYFPSFVRNTIEAPKVVAATTTRPSWSWFGLGSKKSSGTQTYMTDARGQLNRSLAQPTALPVALDIPTNQPSTDNLVTPTSAETVIIDRPSQPIAPGDNRGTVPDFGGKPSRPGEDEVNPLPPAAEPGTQAAVANRMPPVPEVDPSVTAVVDRSESTPPPADDKAPADQVAKPIDPPAAPTPPVVTPPKKTPPTTSPVFGTSKMMPAATKASKVLASPQSVDPSKPPAHVHTTSTVKPTPQAAAAEPWRRPCLRRLIRKVCNLGEFADPPTAAPH